MNKSIRCRETSRQQLEKFKSRCLCLSQIRTLPPESEIPSNWCSNCILQLYKLFSSSEKRTATEEKTRLFKSLRFKSSGRRTEHCGAPETFKFDFIILTFWTLPLRYSLTKVEMINRDVQQQKFGCAWSYRRPPEVSAVCG